MRKPLQYLTLTLLFLCWSTAHSAQLFEDDSVLEFELIGPLHSLIELGEKAEESPFILKLKGEEFPVMVRLRGKSRLRVCKFPPLRLRFVPGEPTPAQFSGIEKFKLVTHCNNNSKGDQNALEEYAAYRLFSLLSDFSYRVRPMKITYSDTDQKLSDKARLHYAFAIEPIQLLAQRVGGAALEVKGLSLSRLNREQAGLVFVYQYMIGNTDWSFVTAEEDDACCHNGDLLDIGNSIYYIPYDFDLAGIVNAKYAKPDPTLRLKSVRQRRYRGYCIDPEYVRTALRQVKSRESEILQAIEDIPGLSDSDRTTMSEYIGQFFKKAQHEDKLLRLYDKRCLGKKV
jgi:hypothetical protein